jgi:hypothetical protein
MNLEMSGFSNIPKAYADDLLAHGTLKHNGQILEIDNVIYSALRAKHKRSAPTRLSKALLGWVSQGMPLTPADVLKTRQETCKACEHFTGSKCKLCGCFTEAKLRMATETCPIGKW